MNRTYSFTLHDDFLLSVTSEAGPSDAEWDKMISVVRDNLQTINGKIAYSFGGAPSAEQRARLREVWIENGVFYPGAIVFSDSKDVERVVQSLRKFGDKNPITCSYDDWNTIKNYYPGITDEKVLELKSVLDGLVKEFSSDISCTKA